MAPVTRSGLSSIPMAEGGLRPTRENYRDASVSWQYVQQPGLRPPRDVSEAPTSSYHDEDAEMMSGEDEDENDPRLLLEGPEDQDDILHPLREAANRVGREVEKFAEVLDAYNPLREEGDERHSRTIDLIDEYHGIAKGTLDRLREKHEAQRRKKDGRAWRKKMRGSNVALETDGLNSDNQEDQPLAPQPGQTTVEDMERWEQETQTWDLLARLVELRYPSSDKEITHQHSVNRYSTAKELWEDFLETDDLALERKTVLEWLKDTAEDSGEDIDELVQELQQNADRGDLIAHGWLHTKHAIKNTKRLLGSHESLDPDSPGVMTSLKNTARTELLVTQLDPDAVTRQGRKLQDEDQYFERSVWLGCYEMLRRGKTADNIREWCMERSEVWRAVSMAAFPDETENETIDEGTNLESWPLWRRMCYSLARNGGNDEYERAVYGVLSGDVSSVEPICRTWDDFVFANYNALLRTQFDDYLGKIYSTGSIPAAFGAFDAVHYHGEPHTVSKRLVQKLGTDRRTRKEALRPMKMLQGVLIANDFPHFIHQQGLALSKCANAEHPSKLIPEEALEPDDLEKYVALDDHDSLRVLTHVLLIFMNLGIDLGGVWTQTAVENVIVSYVSFLRLSGKEELIPLYCSQLSGPRKYAVLSRNLIDVTDHEQRVMQIRLMRELGLDVQEFVHRQARFLFQDYPDTTEGYPATERWKLMTDGPNSRVVVEDFMGSETIERIDMLLIRSVEWYLLVDGLWAETFMIGTLLYLRFLKCMHLHAAVVLAKRLKSDSIAKSKTQAILGNRYDFDGLENGDNEDLTEVLDGSADQKRLLKQQLLEEAKNFRELEALITTLDHIETAFSFDTLLSESSDNFAVQKEIKTSLSVIMKESHGTFPRLLNGWLLTYPSEDAKPQFTELREAYLPQTILAYVSMLNFAGRMLTRDFLLECMELSSVIADEESDLLPLFEKTGTMQELVQGFALAGKTLLLLSSGKKSTGGRPKRLRSKGWTHDLWAIKPAQPRQVEEDE